MWLWLRALSGETHVEGSGDARRAQWRRCPVRDAAIVHRREVREVPTRMHGRCL